MDVEATPARRVQHPLRKNQAIGRHHHHIALRSHDGCLRASSLLGILAIQSQAARLCQGNAMCLRQLFDRRCLELHAPSGGSVRLGEYQRHRETGIEQSLQGNARKIRRTGKNDFHDLKADDQR